ncbi:MAG: ABC transporter permease subunit [Planctomycetes bacterium]|nr:ABC transporter permease subunit [Planctomycetota bacterium]
MKNPIVQRELIEILRTRRALALQVGLASVFALLVVLRWPTDAQVSLSGVQSQQVFRTFGYGMLATLILLVPVFPATTIVREKNQGTLALLLNSPMKPWTIFFGKLFGVLGFVLLLLAMSFPAAAACYAMGGVDFWGQIVVLYGILALVAVQYACVGLLVSSYANSTDSALRITYGLVLLLAVVTLGPHQFLQGQPGLVPEFASWMRNLSPIPAVMELLGQGGVGTQGLISESGAPNQYVFWAAVTSMGLMVWTISRLNYSIFDRARSQGIITDDLGTAKRVLRRMVFVVDPQRRKSGIGWFFNPVMVKEFRCRRFGRTHWLLRMVAACAVLSLTLSIATTTGTMDWDVETIGGILVVLQVALIVLITPSLAAGLISSERESGGWQLLQMTPLSAGKILRGKLMSVVWTLLLILLATLPGYAVMMYIEPGMGLQIQRVLICLLATAGFSLLLSAAVSSLFRRTAPAITTAYVLLFGLCAGTLLIWMGRGAPFGHSTVVAALSINPLATTLSVIKAPGFGEYELLPFNWWFLGLASGCSLLVLVTQTLRLMRPQ